MYKKFLFLGVLSIVQLNVCMDVAREPAPEVIPKDGHTWTVIEYGDQDAIAPWKNRTVAWVSNGIPEKGLKLAGHEGCYAKMQDYGWGPTLHRIWPLEAVALLNVPRLWVRLLTRREARGWMESPCTQPSAGMWIRCESLDMLWVDDLLPSERIKYLRGRAFQRSLPLHGREAEAGNAKEALCLLALKKMRKGCRIDRYCPRDIVNQIAGFVLDNYVHALRAQDDPEMQPDSQLKFKQKTP